MGTSPRVVAMGLAHAAAMGVAEWMWEWRVWRVVQPGESCPAGLEYDQDMATGINRARSPANLRVRLDRVEAAGREAAKERPLAPYPRRPDSPPARAATQTVQSRWTWPRRTWRRRWSTGLATRQWRSCTRTTLGPKLLLAWTWIRQTHPCYACLVQCHDLSWGVVRGGTAGSMPPRASRSTASLIEGTKWRRRWQAPWSALSYSCRRGSPWR